MVALKKYIVYLDDGKNCFKVAVPAENEEAARKFVQGNGEVIAVKDVTDDYKISVDCVVDALKKVNFNETAIEFIERTLFHTGICDC